MNRDCRADAAEVARLPVWHPSALVTLLVAVAITGHVLSGRAADLGPQAIGSPIERAYLPMLLVDWALLVYVCRVARPRLAFAELAGLRGYRTRRGLVDVALALCAAGVIMAGETGWQLAVGSARNASVVALLPSTPSERAVWCAVAVSTGLSEEVVYRGYLTRELARFSGCSLGGVVGQALLFALAHGEQGGATELRVLVRSHSGETASFRGSSRTSVSTWSPV
jgi:uncharacterized protein